MNTDLLDADTDTITVEVKRKMMANTVMTALENIIRIASSAKGTCNCSAVWNTKDAL